jgi:hypothetical protein
MSVELEFACDLVPATPDRPTEAILYPLQIRPVILTGGAEESSEAVFDPATVVCRASTALGHLPPMEIHDVVWVAKNALRCAGPGAVVAQVEQHNAELTRVGRPYVLIGPGRWGNADSGGIPVAWPQIAGARVIIEIWPTESAVPAPGATFLDQIAALGIGYLSVLPDARRTRDPERPFIDTGWLTAQPPQHEAHGVRHLRLTEPLTVAVDGRERRGVLARQPPVDAHPYQQHSGG